MERLHVCVFPPCVETGHISVRMRPFNRTVSGKFSCFGFLDNKGRSQSIALRKKNSLSNFFCSETRSPLTKIEEYQCFADVQDLILLEAKKTELEKNFGRSPTYEEWADYLGCSVCNLYARVGKGRAAKRKMISANLPLVSSLAKEFYGRGLSHQELFQEGVMGLMKSTEKFDVSFGTKFSTYSYFWIRQRMLAAVYKLQNLMMVARSTQKTATFIFQCKDEFRDKHGRNPSMDELSAMANITETKIKQTLSAIRSSKALKFRHKVGNYFNDVDDTENDLSWKELLQKEVKIELGIIFKELSSRESQAGLWKFPFADCKNEWKITLVSLHQIAEALNLSHEAVRMAEKKAIKKLKASADSVDLDNYLCYINNLTT